MKIEESGSVRIDLLGGTLDLHPIGLLTPRSCTLNFATSLKTRVLVQKNPGGFGGGVDRLRNKENL